MEQPSPFPKGPQATCYVRFAPQQVGAVTDTLVTVNNSASQPLLKVRLTGTGEYVPLAIPQNVLVTMKRGGGGQAVAVTPVGGDSA